MESHSMEYNSQKDLLIMPEYGRNVQLLIQYARHLEDKDHRQAFAEKIITLMHQMNPQNKSIEDYRLKLWKHLYHIADYDIDLTTPDGRIPTIDEVRKIPEQVPYPALEARFRHYGHNVQQMVKKAREMEEGSKRDAYIAVIGSYMKLAYRTWNRGNFVSDEFIRNDLATLSENELIIKDDVFLDNLSKPENTKRINVNQSGYQQQHRNNNRKGGYGHNRGGSNNRNNRNNNNNRKYRR